VFVIGACEVLTKGAYDVTGLLQNRFRVSYCETQPNGAGAGLQNNLICKCHPLLDLS
jgi:hypothetical protein